MKEGRCEKGENEREWLIIDSYRNFRLRGKYIGAARML